MRNLILFFMILVIVSVSCNKPKSEEILNDNQQIFKSFWEDFDQNYVGFNLLNVNWDSVYTKHIDQITENTSDSMLFSVFASSLSCLKDGHAQLYANELGLKFNYFYEYRDQKPYNFISWNAISNNYLTNLKSINNKMAYGKIKNYNIGYFLIHSFSESEDDYYSIDDFISIYKESDAIIFDIRMNGGGNERYAQIIASRLVSERLVYRYYKKRNGVNHSDLSKYLPVSLEPDGEKKYEGEIVFLTNRSTFSSAEDFALMLKAIPNTIQVGDTTWGGASTGPELKTISNEWIYTLPLKINYNLTYNPIKHGIIPDYSVNITESDSIAGIDRILEKAIEKIIQ